MARSLVGKAAGRCCTTATTNEQPFIERFAGLFCLVDRLHELARSAKTMQRIGLAVIGDGDESARACRGVGHLRFFSDQACFTVDGVARGFNATLECVKDCHLLIAQVTVIRCGAVSERARFFDQGRFASLQLAQLLTHLGFSKINGRKKTTGSQLTRWLLGVRPTGRFTLLAALYGVLPRKYSHQGQRIPRLVEP